MGKKRRSSSKRSSSHGSVKEPPHDFSPHHGAQRLGVFENRSYTAEEHHEWALKLWNRILAHTVREGRDEHRDSITKDDLNCDEFQDVLHSVMCPDNEAGGHATYGRAEVHIHQALDFCLRKATLSKDGTLSFKEFKSLMRTLRNQGDAGHRVHLIWALFDLDGSNTIDKEEFRGVYAFFVGHQPTLLEVDEAFESMDKFDKKEVTRAQFIRWMKTDAPPAFKQHAAGVDADDGEDSRTSEEKKEERRLTLMRLKGRDVHRPAPGMFHPRPDSEETWTQSWHVFWNDRFRGRDTALVNPDYPDRLRTYFSAPQTLHELERFYCTYKGFGKHRKELYRKEPPRPNPVLSTQSRTMDVNWERAAPGGTAKNAKGDPILWDNEWPDKASDFCKRPQPGTLFLRCQKPPPILYMGRDEGHYAFKASRSTPLLKPIGFQQDEPVRVPTF